MKAPSMKVLYVALALTFAVAAVTRFLDTFEPYARKYLDEGWLVAVSEDEIDSAVRLRSDDADQPA
jgi:hypothetical protein